MFPVLLRLLLGLALTTFVGVDFVSVPSFFASFFALSRTSFPRALGERTLGTIASSDASTCEARDDDGGWELAMGRTAEGSGMPGTAVTTTASGAPGGSLARDNLVQCDSLWHTQRGGNTSPPRRETFAPAIPPEDGVERASGRVCVARTASVAANSPFLRTRSSSAGSGFACWVLSGEQRKKVRFAFADRRVDRRGFLLGNEKSGNSFSVVGESLASSNLNSGCLKRREESLSHVTD